MVSVRMQPLEITTTPSKIKFYYYGIIVKFYYVILYDDRI